MEGARPAAPAGRPAARPDPVRRPLHPADRRIHLALAARDTARFWEAILLLPHPLVVAFPIYAFYYFGRDTLGIQWRRWLTGAS